MDLVSSNGLLLSRHNRARQLVIFAHGDFQAPYCCGLFRGDGRTSLPISVPKASLFFYTSHNSSEVGFSVLQEVMLFPVRAFEGLNCRDAVALEDNDEPGPEHLSSNMKVVDEKKLNDSVRNYAIYHHSSGQEKIDKHQAEENKTADGAKNTDVDLLIVTDDSRKNLSDVFSFCEPYRYARYHFVACRVER